MTADQLANLALSLKDNEAFQAALSGQRSSALDKLATIDADDKNGIIAAQAIVAVIDNIKSDLEAFIRAGAARKPAGIA